MELQQFKLISMANKKLPETSMQIKTMKTLEEPSLQEAQLSQSDLAPVHFAVA
jgi:hypothetical protein